MGDLSLYVNTTPAAVHRESSVDKTFSLFFLEKLKRRIFRKALQNNNNTHYQVNDVKAGF